MRAPSLLLLFLILHQSILSFCDDDTRTYLDRESSHSIYRPTWPSRETIGVRFEFRTLEANAMLVFYSYEPTVNTTENPRYAMGLVLNSGSLQAIHLFPSYFEIVTVGKGLSNDAWHNASLTKTPDGNFTITVDGKSKSLQLMAYTDGGAADIIQDLGHTPTSAVYIGGVDRTKGFSGLPRDSLVGCVRNVEFMRSEVWHKNVTYETTVGTEEGCQSACMKDSCKNKGVCINRYSGFSCDCFGTKHEGKNCETKGETTLTFFGLNSIEYKQYNSSDRVHRAVNRVSLQFKLSTVDQESSVLFYGSGPLNHLAISVYNRQIRVSIDFGDGPYTLNGTSNVTTDKWHSVTLYHQEQDLTLDIDGAVQKVAVTGQNYHLQLDPTIYVAGGINLAGHAGLPTGRNFVGCMKNVYYNSVNILYEFSTGNDHVQAIGGQPRQGCAKLDYTPLSFPTFKSQLILEWGERVDLKTSFEFRTNQRTGLLLMTKMYIGNTTDYASLTVSLTNDRMEVHMDVKDGDETKKFWTYTGSDLNDSEWHSCQVELSLSDGGVMLFLDNSVVYIETNRELIKKLGGLRPATDVYFGGGFHNQPRGFVGCIRKIVFQNSNINPLDTIASGEANGLTLDGCNMQDLCAERDKTNPCEHNAECYQDWMTTHCNCEGSGYDGTVCHFPLHKRSCEDFYQLGFRRSGVRQIDPDGVGPLPPSYVYCEMDIQQMGDFGSTTVIDHNLPESTSVRKYGYSDFKKVLEYREMTNDALAYLISQSESCRQDITYECIKAPLYLGDQTWFMSANGVRFDKESSLTSNCSKNDATERADVATVTKQQHLPLQELYFLQEKNTVSTNGKISLSPLKCRGDKRYYDVNAVTFTTADSYLLLDAWGEGDLSFSFRTLGKNVALLFQATSRHSKDYVWITVVDGSSVEFTFHTGVRELTVTIRTRGLDDGDWHYVAIEYNEYHVRFTVDMKSSWLNLIDQEDFGPFHGPLYIGSVGDYHKTDTPSFQGCFRLLTINHNIIPLQDFINSPNNGSKTDGIEPGCQRSCDPNPCQHDAVCTELWGSYFCTCVDISHKGRNCEENYLLDVIAFPEPEALIKVEAVDKSILTSDIRFEFRSTQLDLLLLYAHDELGNFIQIAFLRGYKLEFKFNSGDDIILMLMEIQQEIVNGEWQQVGITREEDKTTIELNGEKKEILVKMELLTENIPNFRNPEQVDVHPALPTGSGNDSIQFTHVYLGGVNATMIDPYNPDTIGLEGCLRAFFVHEVPYSLQRAALPYPNVYDFCTPYCLDNPCKNKGVCEESWDSYTCDCTKTGGYRGDHCEIDIGANFHNTTYLLYQFNPVNTTYVQPPQANDPTRDDLDFAFIANGTSGILAYIRGKLYSKEDEYIILELNEQGAITGRINLGYGEQTIYGPIKGVPYNDGQRHWLSFQRRERNVVLDVDDTEKVIQALKTPSHHALFDEKDAIVIGGIEEDVEQFNLHSYKQFSGCISEFEYNGIRPIDYYFGEDEFDPTIVAAEGGDLTAASCSVYSPTVPLPMPAMSTIVPTTTSPFLLATFPPWYPGKAKTVYLHSDEYFPPSMPETQIGDSSVETVVIILLVVITVGLLLAIVCVIHNMNKEDDKQKKKEGYDTLPLTEMEEGSRRQNDENNYYSTSGRDGGYKRHIDEPMEDKKVVVPPPKPPHIYRPNVEDDADDDLPVKEPIKPEHIESDSDDEPHRRPIQAPDEEMEWDPVADTTLVADTPNLSPTSPDTDNTDQSTEDLKQDADEQPSHDEPESEVTEPEREPEPLIVMEQDPEPIRVSDTEPEPEREPEPMKISGEPELEWDDDISPNDQLPPHERLVSFEERPEDVDQKPIMEEPIIAEEDEATETTPFYVKDEEEDDCNSEQSPVIQPKSKDVKYEPLENEPDSADELDHGVKPTEPVSNDAGHQSEEEMIQADIMEPPEHTSKKAELKTQVGVPHDLNLNDVNHVPNTEDDDPIEDGMPGEYGDAHENNHDTTTPQRKKKKKKSSRRGSSTSGQSLS